MRLHVDACKPQEACGLLAGKGESVGKVMPIANQMQSSVRFRMDPQEQLLAFNWIEANGLELVGIFHSHPAGPDAPSATDIAEASYPVVYLIWSHSAAEWSVKGYHIEGPRVTEIPLELVDSD